MGEMMHQRQLLLPKQALNLHPLVAKLVKDYTDRLASRPEVLACDTWDLVIHFGGDEHHAELVGRRELRDIVKRIAEVVTGIVIPELSLPAELLEILDVGHGTGVLATKLASLGCAVTAVDITPAMQKRAKARARRAHQSIEFHWAAAHELLVPEGPFEPDSFELVIWSRIGLHLLNLWEDSLRQAMMVLRNGGYLLILESMQEGNPPYQRQPQKNELTYIHSVSDYLTTLSCLAKRVGLRLRVVLQEQMEFTVEQRTLLVVQFLPL